MRRRQYLATGTGLLATTSIATSALVQDDGEADDGDADADRDDGAFDAFATELEASLEEVDASLVSHCECPRFSEVAVTTRGEAVDDEPFHEELGIVAGEYAGLVDRTDDPPAFGVLAYVYDSPDAATESITDPFARYTIRTEWAADYIESDDADAYLERILLSLDPPLDTEENGSEPADGGSSDAGDAQIEIVDHELVHDDSGFLTETYVAATVQNAGDGATGDLSLEARWYSEGDYVDADTAYLRTLGAGETWRAQVPYFGSDGTEIDEYELAHEVDQEPPTAPDGLELVDGEMRIGEDEAVVEGRIENATGDEQSYLEAIVTFYDADGAVLADEWTNVTDVPDGETWAFEVTWFALDRVDEVAEYEVTVSNRL